MIILVADLWLTVIGCMKGLPKNTEPALREEGGKGPVVKSTVSDMHFRLV